jgi:NAD(P) transhydrogenase
LNEEMCQHINSSYVVGIAHYSDLPALALGAADDGMLKLVFSRNDRRLMGVHAVGDGATELAHFGAVFVSTGGCIDELACLPVVAHSLFEAFPVAAQDALRRLTPAQPRRRKPPLSPSADG